MSANPVLLPELSGFGPGCDPARCQRLTAMIPGVFGRSSIMLHDPLAHELYGERRGGLKQTGAPTVITGRLAVDLLALEARIDGEPVMLSATETRLLMYLARRPDETVPVDEVIAMLWGRSELAMPNARANARMVVNRLRGRLGPARHLVVTMLGLGYRLLVLPPGADAPERYRLGGQQGFAYSGVWAKSGAERCRFCGQNDVRHWAHGACRRRACRNAANAERRPS
jgi:hypothetical protein